MIESLRAAGRLGDLNFQNIPNRKEVEDEFTALPFDPSASSYVPLTWRTVGIAYNVAILDETPRTWSDLFTPISPDR
ncbi:MAG: ABC transporter substrate-binding protein [Candidatus Synoicihabitans palmerolidicus]|nr:ABC transporter substrate-binding protein [Candidatus Synoicihabitans palmerolidicus]MCC5025745.1 ABC transporter substrate-binding protein [Candidatus Synoicihabitans palmerolidicus]MCC5025887.1 ABC transporter substrate-binding protein [Candidatus Synoicihabitans palmerolidicus]MCC5025928.1 ABC transporter substrate-binding protein [Candidatus Synoicihabitans palmerolidicus]MCC5025967.1 ABC transporter substrate-binding protein [Candidatus Synoicihabitans palmerolidicus]